MFSIHISAVLAIAISFALILLLYRFGLPLGPAMISGALVLVLAGGSGVQGLCNLGLSFLAPENWLLFLVIPLDLLLTGLLEQSGRMQRTVGALQVHIRNPRALFATMPAMIGLLPMPGGAVFSAPLVEAGDRQNNLSPELKGAVNYWYRHLWELWWPLYPGVVLAMKYSGYTAGAFALLLAPLMLVSIAAGWFWILRLIPKDRPEKAGPGSPAGLADLSASLLPIGIVIVGTLVLAPLFSRHLGMHTATANFSALLAGLAAANLLVFARFPRWTAAAALLTGKQSRSLLVIVAGIIAFSAALQLQSPDGATLVTRMRDELLSTGLPPWPVLLLIPFIAGMVTGITMAFVGASFPIIYGFALNDPAAAPYMAAITVLAYISGYIGMILSPVHLCLVISAEYFKGNMRGVYRRIAAPTAALATAGILLSGAWYLFGKDILKP